MGYATIIGPYRYHNFGDDLIGAIIAKYLKENNINVCIPFLSKDNSNWLSIEYSDNYRKALKKVDIIIIGGGGILGDSGVRPNNYYRKLGLKAAIYGRLLGKNIIITGVGAGPLKLRSSKILTKLLAFLSKKVGVRDLESRLFLEELGVNQKKLVEGADLALLSNNYFNINRIRSNKIGIQFDVNYYTDIKQNSNLNDIIKALKNYINSNSKKIILISNGNAKPQFLESEIPDFETLCYNKLESFLPILAGIKFIITSHLHLAIAAFAYQIPCFSLYVREKTKRFYNQIGYPERAVDLKSARIEDLNRIFIEAEKATWTHKDEERLQLLKNDASKLLEILKIVID